MRRFWTFLICCVLMAGVIVMPARADSAASLVESYITVTPDGDCMVSTTVRLRMESPVESLSFPLPLNATDITVNSGTPRTTKTDTAIEVDVSRTVGGITGDVQLAFSYNIPGAVKPITDPKLLEDNPEIREKYLQLDVPLLNSFALPVEQLSFVLTMPDNIPYHPVFNSIYQQTGIDASLT